ncbi:hypothetical protein AVDCRST_MAG92-5089 [uncultured Coleofasciculus sp.]|uniref:KOW domain-containing protein n=1 Tax=uncultured Coleofasciculus sp. TaxID=1267456 RepID=A0A6J4KD47_9CYAN|nr:hypothetical protein AVDCRST_MAG92-5089 [uncultured Coleofasciculus sp.]
MSQKNVQVGNRVKILQPTYVAGKTGVICGREELLGVQLSERWLIRVASETENIVVSVTLDEFQILS